MTERYTLRERCIRLGLSQGKRCEISKLSRPHYAEVEAGRKPLMDKTCTKLEHAFELIERGENKNGQKGTTEAINTLSLATMPQPAPVEPVAVTRRIPVVGLAAATMYDPALSQICDLWDASNETVPCVIDRDGIFAVRIQGDSMEPDLHDGDVVAIDPNTLPATGDVAIVCLRTKGLVIKRWVLEKRHHPPRIPQPRRQDL